MCQLGIGRSKDKTESTWGDESDLLELVTQEGFDEGCGQAALATAAGAPMLVSVQVVGKGNRTRAKDLIEAAAALGLVCLSSRAVRWSKRKPPPTCALVLFRWEGHDLGHWVLYHDGYVYDPDPHSPGEPVRVEEYDLAGARPTSYLPLDAESLQAYKFKRHRIGRTSPYRLQYGGEHMWKLTIVTRKWRSRWLATIEATSYQKAVAQAVVWILRATGEL